MSKHFCPRCRSSSPLVYQDTPICLQPSCTLFFREVQAKSDSSSCAQALSYSTELLRLQPADHQPVSADSIIPPSPSADTRTSRPFAKGMHCRVCGRLSTRYTVHHSESSFPTDVGTRFKWEAYECSHCHVGFPTLSVRTTHNITNSVSTKPLALCSPTRTSGSKRVASNSTSIV
jgi:hypothetical protein